MRVRAAQIASGMVLAITLAGLPAVPAAVGAPRARPAALTTVNLAGGDIVALPGPARLLDTVAGLGANGTVSFVVTGRGGIPAAGVGAVVGRVRVVNPPAAGNATVYPNGGVLPSAKTLQFGAGATRETLTIAIVGAGGRVVLHNGSTHALRFVFDATGYVPDTAAYTPLPAVPRVLSAAAGSVAAAGAKTFAVGGSNGIPATGVGAVVARVSVAGPTTNGSATLYPAGHVRPGSPTLAWHAGAATETLTLLPLGDAGKLTLHNEATHSAGFNVDVLGYLLDTSTFHALNAPARLLNATTAANADTIVKIAGKSGIPASSIGTVVARVGAVTPTAAGNATVYRTGGARPSSTTLAYAGGATANTLTVVALSADGKVTVHNGVAKSTHFTLDVLGWFDAVGSATQSTKIVIPPTTRLAGQNDIVSANADVTAVVLRPTADVPPVGGHLLVPPRADGTRGITAEVLSSVAVAGGTKLTLAATHVYDVVADMEIHDHRPLRLAPGANTAGIVQPDLLGGQSLGLVLAKFGPVTCTGSVSVSLETLLPAVRLTLDDVDIQFDYSLSQRFIHFALLGTANGEATVHIPGNFSCTAEVDLPPIPMGWVTATFGIGITLATEINEGVTELTLSASAPAVLGFEYSGGEMHNLSDLSFDGDASTEGDGIDAHVSLTPFVDLKLALISEKLLSPEVTVKLGMEIGLGPNPDGFFGPHCNSVTLGPILEMSVGLEIEYFPDIDATLGSISLPPIHLWDGPCTAYAGTISLNRDFSWSDPAIGSQHFTEAVTMTFDGATPAKLNGIALQEPYTWNALQVFDTANICGAHAHQEDKGPGAVLGYDGSDFIDLHDGIFESARYYTNFHQPPLTTEGDNWECGGLGPSHFCCQPAGAIDVLGQPYGDTSNWTHPARLGPDLLAGGFSDTLTATSLGEGNAVEHITIQYSLTAVEATP